MHAFRQKLLAWYDRAARDLPWRHSQDPYAIWVSEVMLQQTRVDTVIPYYERFLEQFPTPAALAGAEEDEVLSRWSGLGYYRRARLLHAGAQELVARYGGEIPEDAEQRRALPGVGRYTAGAIGSIAFGKEEAVVDGNVSRVLARLFRIDSPIGAAATTRRLWEEAERLVPGKRPGEFNQALMELGATVCTPKQTGCTRCPVSAHCEAYAHGEVEKLPVARARKKPKELELSAVVATSGRTGERKVWLVKGERALFGGLWSLPMLEGAPRQALHDSGLEARLQSKCVAKVEHVLSHRRLRIEVFRATGAKGTRSGSRRAFTEASLEEVGISSLTRKLLAAASFR